MMNTLLLALLILQAPASSGQTTATKPENKCSIEGVVVKATTGDPLKKASVTLQKADGRETPAMVTTGADGRFALKDIEPGRYYLSVDRNGYASADYGPKGANVTGIILALSPGQRFCGSCGAQT